jgi:hypothetical protein
MSIDWLQDLERAIDNGREYFVVPGVQSNEFVISSEIETLRAKAQRTANSRKFQANVFRLVNKMDTVSDDCYLVVRKILDPSPQGDPRFQWSVVDTREAAEMMRDVSQGPTPYFGAVIEETFEPK